MKLFRSLRNDLNQSGLQVTTSSTLRPPANVPYLVDNLWEWLRPPQFPSRRSSVFASPRPDLAQRSGPQGGKVWRVSFPGRFTLCQVRGFRDSKDHPECKSLPKLLLKELGKTWTGLPLSQKRPAGQLWIPCLSKLEVDQLFGELPELQRIRERIVEAIDYWNQAVLIEDPVELPDAEGEVFFTAEDGYYLQAP